jgi:hypothetical protein
MRARRPAERRLTLKDRGATRIPLQTASENVRFRLADHWVKRLEAGSGRHPRLASVPASQIVDGVPVRGMTGVGSASVERLKLVPIGAFACPGPRARHIAPN